MGHPRGFVGSTTSHVSFVFCSTYLFYFPYSFSLLLFFLLFPHPLDLSLPSFPLFSQPISLFSSQRETRVLFSEAREKLRLTYESHWEEISNFRQFFSLLFSLLFLMVSIKISTDRIKFQIWHQQKIVPWLYPLSGLVGRFPLITSILLWCK